VPIVVWGLGQSLILRGRRERKVSENYKRGSFVICAAEQTVFG